MRAPGSPEEKRWTADMGGNRSTKALFYLKDRVRTGDRIHCDDMFDEPRVITKVDPNVMADGSTSHWVAEMMPESQWERENRPAAPSFVAAGQGARINYGSVDQSVQQFQNHSPELGAVMRELDAITAAIEQLASAVDRTDASIDVEQIKSELRRSRPEKGRIWQSLERLNTFGGVAEKTVKLAPLLDQLLNRL